MKKSQSEAESLEVPSTVNGTSSCSKIEVLESDVHKDDSSIKKKKRKKENAPTQEKGSIVKAPSYVFCSIRLPVYWVVPPTLREGQLHQFIDLHVNYLWKHLHRHTQKYA
jgi:hypothetical protein